MGRVYISFGYIISLLLIFAILASVSFAQEETGTTPKDTGKTEAKNEEPAGKELQPYTKPDIAKRKVFAPASEKAEGGEQVKTTGGASVWVALFSLIIVIGLIFGVYYVFRKFVPNMPRIRSGKAVQFLARRYLDTKNSLALIKVGNRILLIGITLDGMSLLAEFSEEKEIDEIMSGIAPEEVASKQGSFIDIIKRAFRQSEPTREEEELSKIGVEVEKVRKQVENLNKGN